MSYECSFDVVFDTVKNAKGGGRAVSLLIGAGCSVTAGIPLASGFVEQVEQRWPGKCRPVPEPHTYPACMAALTRAERRDLVAEYVDQARINWPHLCIALLIQHGYVDRVLTTNFDPLVVRACALLNQFPAVYDFAASQEFRAADIPDQAVFYLHGQRGGFVQLHTDQDCRKHGERMRPVFDHASSGRVWIVVGYSGDNDPVFTRLAEVPYFHDGLYWVGYRDNSPGPHVRAQLLDPGKDAFFLPGYDADGFFVELTRKLDLFPPALLENPFTHLAAWAHIMLGSALHAQAKQKQGEEADALFAQAGEKYAQALAIKPDKHEALNNWAVALCVHGALPHAGERAAELFALAKEKALAAEQVKPGAGAYNAACACARLGEVEECRHWLETCRNLGRLPSRKHMETDCDLASVRDTNWFHDILAKAPE